MMQKAKRILGLILTMVLLAATSTVFAEGADDAAEAVVPVTWEPSPEHPMIDTDEARALYARIAAGDYLTMEELKANRVVAQLDALSAYYKGLYGNTAEIDTPERDAMRREVLEQFLTLGSARKVTEADGTTYFVTDGELKREFRFELVLGLSGAGKSTTIVNPDSEEMGAFILDPDTIKEMLPEYRESHGAAADSIHFEGMAIMKEAMQAFLSGDMNGVNVILPIVATDLDELMEEYIRPFEAAGYHVNVKLCPAVVNEAMSRVIMRTLGGGQLINTTVLFSFGSQPEEVYYELAPMLNPDGVPYGDIPEEELLPAA